MIRLSPPFCPAISEKSKKNEVSMKIIGMKETIIGSDEQS